MTFESHPKISRHPNAPANALDQPTERLVLVGFRTCMAGYEHNCMDCWKVAWTEFVDELGLLHGRRTFRDMRSWVILLRAKSCRPIACFPHLFPQVCRDEALVLSIASALQEGQRNLARAAAVHLTNTTSGDAIDTLVDAADSFAAALKEGGGSMVPVTPSVIEAIAEGIQKPQSASTRLH